MERRTICPCGTVARTAVCVQLRGQVEWTGSGTVWIACPECGWREMPPAQFNKMMWPKEGS